MKGPRPPTFCVQPLAGRVASRSPFHGEGGMGGFQRRSPTGGAAKGTPLNTAMLPAKNPRRVPLERVTTGPLFAGAQNSETGKDARRTSRKERGRFRRFMSRQGCNVRGGDCNFRVSIDAQHNQDPVAL